MRIASGAGLDGVNRPTWSRAVSEYLETDTWTDRGERNALTMLAPRVRGRRILDVGVGAGRSAWLLRLLSSDYRAIDYTAEMVDAARAALPGVDVRVGDARDLSGVVDGDVDFLTFSFNGLDALDHADRQLALAEFHRVIASDGVILFSALNKDGRGWGLPPSAIHGEGGPVRRALRFVSRLPGSLARYRLERRNWARLRPRMEDHGDWGIAPLSAHSFGLLVHFATLGGVRRELAHHGFEVEAVFSHDGSRIDPSAESCRAEWFHVIAAKAREGEDTTAD